MRYSYFAGSDTRGVSMPDVVAISNITSYALLTSAEVADWTALQKRLGAQAIQNGKDQASSWAER